MLTLVKRDFFINSWLSYGGIALILIISYLILIPPIFMFAIIFMTLLITLFYEDDKNKVNRFLISLPVAKTQIAQSRYMFLACLAIVLLSFQWVFMLVSKPIASIADPYYIYDWRDFTVILCIGLLMIAICLPIFYMIPSFLLGAGINVLLFVIGTILILTPLTTVLGMTDTIYFNELDQGFVLLAEKYIPRSPYFVLIISSCTLYYISIKVTDWVITKRNS
ncbi:ABC-2 transporter permease [Lentibacillus sp. N15]|uniref:ABC-2 transporter permease n=1 Tax=Lentibacillus songyuanensis TaxID=3136161 RepID=UPI0031BBBC93